MRSNLIKALVIFIVVWLGAFISRKYGFYNSVWYVDILLHILSGIGSSFVFYAFSRHTITSKVVHIVSILSFAVLVSLFWELWEFSGWHLIPSDMPFYGPILSDSLGDMVSGLFGGVVFVVLFILTKKQEV